MESLWPYGISWIYLYGVGGATYAAGSVFCVKAGTLDLSDPREKKAFVFATACLVFFAVMHGLFQFVFPFVG